jgi:hypothetical protein
VRIAHLQSNLNRIPDFSLLREPTIIHNSTRQARAIAPDTYHVPNPSMGILAPVLKVASGIDISQAIIVMMMMLLLLLLRWFCGVTTDFIISGCASYICSSKFRRAGDPVSLSPKGRYLYLHSRR